MSVARNYLPLVTVHFTGDGEGLVGLPHAAGRGHEGGPGEWRRARASRRAISGLFLPSSQSSQAEANHEGKFSFPRQALAYLPHSTPLTTGQKLSASVSEK